MYYDEDDSLTALLLAACRSRNVDEAKKLLLRGASVDAEFRFSSGTSPILVACETCCFDMAKMLLDAGAKVTAREKSPILCVVQSACDDAEAKKALIELLLVHGADVNERPNCWLPPLHEAAFANCAEIVAFLIEKGANVGPYSGAGTLSALDFACLNGCVASIRVLLDADGTTVDMASKALFLAVTTVGCIADARWRMVELLVRRGACVNHRGIRENTALHGACRNRKCSPQVVDYLLRHGADVDARNVDGLTALHAVSRRFEEPSLTDSEVQAAADTVRLLLRKGADPDSCDDSGESPFLKAVREDNVEMIELFLSCQGQPVYY